MIMNIKGQLQFNIFLEFDNLYGTLFLNFEPSINYMFKYYPNRIKEIEDFLIYLMSISNSININKTFSKYPITSDVKWIILDIIRKTLDSYIDLHKMKWLYINVYERENNHLAFNKYREIIKEKNNETNCI